MTVLLFKSTCDDKTDMLFMLAKKYNKDKYISNDVSDNFVKSRIPF